MVRKTPVKYVFISIAMAVFFMAFVTGCSDTGSAEEQENMEMEHEDEHEHDASEEDVIRIPNDGAVIRIVSPENGAAFAVGEDIVVEVEIEDFELNVDGSHWHVYVDGVSYGMVVGNTTRQVLRNLEAGEHMVTAHLANGDHEELEDPGMIMITVTE